MNFLHNRRWVGIVVILTGIVSLAWMVKGHRPESQARSAPAAEPLRVVTSLGIFADMAANVGGSAIEVTALIPPGTDPHTWEPSIRELRALADADIFIYNGLGLEPWVERTLSAVAPSGLRTVVLTAGLQPLGETHFHVSGPSPGHSEATPKDPGPKDGHSDPVHGDSGIDGRSPRGGDSRGGEPYNSSPSGDPHMWLDPVYGIAYARRMEAAFSEAMPSAADEFKQRAGAYIEQLESLHEWFQAQVDRIPPERRMLITDHDAYVYMAERYGLKRAGFVTANPDREPSARELAQLARVIRETGTPALFAEPHVGTSFIAELARDTKVAVGILYTDAFFGDVRTYIDLLRANGETLRALLGDSP